MVFYKYKLCHTYPFVFLINYLKLFNHVCFYCEYYSIVLWSIELIWILDFKYTYYYYYYYYYTTVRRSTLQSTVVHNSTQQYNTVHGSTTQQYTTASTAAFTRVILFDE